MVYLTLADRNVQSRSCLREDWLVPCEMRVCDHSADSSQCGWNKVTCSSRDDLRQVHGTPTHSLGCYYTGNLSSCLNNWLDPNKVSSSMKNMNESVLIDGWEISSENENENAPSELFSPIVRRAKTGLSITLAEWDYDWAGAVPLLNLLSFFDQITTSCFCSLFTPYVIHR